MSFLEKLASSGIGSFAEKIAGIIDRFKLSDQEKADLALEMERLQQAAASELEQTMRQELQAKERILVAELNQGDTYTKRARPTVVYFGLFIIFFNYSLVPLLATLFDVVLPSMDLPSEFWYAWGGIVGTWSVGRSMERRGANNNLVSMITGNKARGSILENAGVTSIFDKD